MSPTTESLMKGNLFVPIAHHNRQRASLDRSNRGDERLDVSRATRYGDHTRSVPMSERWGRVLRAPDLLLPLLPLRGRLPGTELLPRGHQLPHRRETLYGPPPCGLPTSSSQSYHHASSRFFSHSIILRAYFPSLIQSHMVVKGKEHIFPITFFCKQFPWKFNVGLLDDLPSSIHPLRKLLYIQNGFPFY